MQYFAYGPSIFSISSQWARIQSGGEKPSKIFCDTETEYYYVGISLANDVRFSQWY
jgi:hypothetical protein